MKTIAKISLLALAILAGAPDLASASPAAFRARGPHANAAFRARAPRRIVRAPRRLLRRPNAVRPNRGLRRPNAVRRHAH